MKKEKDLEEKYDVVVRKFNRIGSNNSETQTNNQEEMKKKSSLKVQSKAV